MRKIMIFCCLWLWSIPAQAVCSASITATTPSSAFVKNGNGTTVTHKKTNLMWRRCSMGLNGTTCTGTAILYTWQAALNAVKNLNAGAGFAGFKDWRLPNIKELSSIVENKCANPAMNNVIFPNVTTPQGSYYWSSSPSIHSLVFFNGVGVTVWTINFADGSVLESRQGVNPFPVRLVRGGQ